MSVRRGPTASMPEGSADRSPITCPPAALRALVVDDEPLARDELAFLLGEIDGVEVVGEAADTNSALAAVAEHQPDVVFVDLRMPGPDGLAFAESLRHRRPETAVVVVSAYDEGALRAFDASVTDYLLKPVRLERLRRALTRVRSRAAEVSGDAPASPDQTPLRGRETRGAAPEAGATSPVVEADAVAEDGGDSSPLRRVAVRRRGAFVVVDLADVLCFEVRDEFVWAVTRDDRFALDFTLAAVEKRLPEGFFRCHRGAIVKLSAIRAIEPSGAGTFELVLDRDDAHRVPLARERARTLRALIPFAG
ncbi:MAG TPA: LytTR family DNA-binding domain-containing protein [Polyangiaceae bacterium LLY-WYZ-14_1]|nr:LytTR family DNA-binding domain-containing protein [Polyangiaceae bacterium LLY-WYZ-14_1]